VQKQKRQSSKGPIEGEDEDTEEFATITESDVKDAALS
jgi:hypothetical protein